MPNTQQEWEKQIDEQDYWILIEEKTDSGCPKFERVNRQLKDKIRTLLIKRENELVLIVANDCFPGKLRNADDEEYAEIDPEGVSYAKGWNEALEAYRHNLIHSLKNTSISNPPVNGFRE